MQACRSQTERAVMTNDRATMITYCVWSIGKGPLRRLAFNGEFRSDNSPLEFAAVLDRHDLSGMERGSRVLLRRFACLASLMVLQSLRWLMR